MRRANSAVVPLPAVIVSVFVANVSVTYSADDGTIHVGDEQLRATMSSSGGGTQAATDAVWESDAPAVATVSSSGLVTAISAGEATIIAEVTLGGRGSLRLRVSRSFHGHWEGRLNVARMTASPDWRDLGARDCEGPENCTGHTALAGDFTQGRATVAGSVTVTLPAPLNWEWTVQSGSVSIDGLLTLTFDEAAARVPGTPGEPRASLAWESRADTPGELTGTAAIRMSSDALSGSVVMEGCFGSIVQGGVGADSRVAVPPVSSQVAGSWVACSAPAVVHGGSCQVVVPEGRAQMGVLLKFHTVRMVKTAQRAAL